MTSASSAYRDAYNLPRWSEGYAQINEAGNLCIYPDPTGQEHIDLTCLAADLKAAGLRMPALVRFPGILHHRVQCLVTAFQQAMNEFDYRGTFTPVYPIKVNQQQPVVEQIVRGQELAGVESIGLEAGSKPELIAILAQVRDTRATIVCNGYKDAHFIRLALMAEKLGHRVFLVVEKLSELPLILAEAERLQVQPRLGVRARLATIGKGNWQNTGGEKSKFGLSASQILTMVRTLSERGQLSVLQLLHFHLGSQLANIHDIHTGLTECGRIFSELAAIGVDVRWLDVGGGLGVDYEGTGSRSYCSMNYSMAEYARKVVGVIHAVCEETGVRQPNIITESGRAMTAHHAVLLAEIIDHEPALQTLPDEWSEPVSIVSDHAPACLKELGSVVQQLQQPCAAGALTELFHRVQQGIEDSYTAFSLGLMNLQQRADAESLYSQASQLLMRQLNPANRTHRPMLDELHDRLADKVFVNFSLFQSLPDVWGIDQIFPILPVSGLNQPMRHRGVLQDITCDSDGRIDDYVDSDGLGSSLPLPSVERGDLLAFFMVGAYQEILGDLHNLFGDTDSVDVVLDGEVSAGTLNDGKCGYRIQHPIQGDTIAGVLDYVNFDPADIRARLLGQVDASHLSEADKAMFQQELSESLQAYTYLMP